MNNLCFNRFTLRTDDVETRRKILRWLALNYRLYEYFPSDAEVRGRFISCKPFPAEAFRRQIGKLYGDRTLFRKYPLIPTLWMIFEDSTFAFRSGDKHRSRRIYGK